MSNSSSDLMPSLTIKQQMPGDERALSDLAAEAFGPGRFARSSYRVREGVPPVEPLSLTAWRDGRLVGGIRFTAIGIGAQENALLLGPLVVAPSVKGNGYGRALAEAGLARAREAGYALVLLVGDTPYYGRFGFAPVLPPGKIVLPGPVDPARMLALELQPGALASASGKVKAYAR